MRVLICEDDAILAMDIEIMAEDLGHSVCGICGSARECLGILGDLRPEVVTVDMNLRDGRTGPKILRRLQSEGIPAIILSSELLDPSDHGAVTSLLKPVGAPDLHGALETARARSV